MSSDVHPDKCIFIFDANGIGCASIDWPWTAEQIAAVDASGARHAILDKALPDAWCMDEDGSCYARQEVVLSASKARIVADGADCCVITGLPEGADLSVNGELVEGGEAFALIAAEPGLKYVQAVGILRSNLLQIEAHDLAAYRAGAAAQIDAAAEACRMRVITPGSGQAMTYLRKAEAARAFLAGGMPDGAQRDRILDEAARLNVSPEAAAQSIIETAESWEVMDRLVDKVRLDAKAAIEAAATLDAVDAVTAGLAWPA